MNIRHLIDVIEAGGPGSGCDPEVAKANGTNCGRPPGDKEKKTYVRPKVIKVKDVSEAVQLILEGKHVELPDIRSVYTTVHKLAEMASEAKKLGKDAPNYDLCQVSVANTNMFCAEGLKTDEFPDGIPRIKMPQLGGKPVPGTDADKLPRNKWDNTEVDGAKKFIEHMESLGIKVTRETENVAKLKASQRELVGPKVAKMMLDKDFEPANNPLFVSRDNYVVDGHHRWAAVVGRDAEDGAFTKDMPILRVDAPISEVLDLANKWSKKFGIQQVGMVNAARRRK